MYTNSIHIWRYEIVCKIASSCDRILKFNFPVDDVSVDRKWVGSISWCNCIFSISLDDDLHSQVLSELQDTVFSWNHCKYWEVHRSIRIVVAFCTHLEKKIFNESMISRKFLFADHQNTIQKIRDSDRDIAVNTSHFIHFLSEIHDQYIRLSKTLSSNHLQAQFPIIDDRSKCFLGRSLIHHHRKSVRWVSQCEYPTKWYLSAESN